MFILKQKTYILSILFLIITLHSSIAQTLDENTRQQITAIFGEHKENAPGAVLIINRDGAEIYRHIFGYANLETGTKITDETVFEAASVSKQFTAASILLLVEEGKLALSDDIRTYFPELPDYGHKITVQHLLTHTSGLKDWRNIVYIMGWPTGKRVYTQDFALNLICKQSNLNFKPGDQYRYCNSGYDLLGLLVERVSNKSFAAFVKDNLLVPAGMTHSAIRGKFTDIVKHRANGYLTVKNQYIQGQTLDETYGAAGLQTTAADLQKWNAFIYSDKVSNAFKKMRIDPFELNDGTRITYANGGVLIQKHNGYDEISHGGLISGYRAWIGYYPKAKLSVSYMSNDRTISPEGTAKKIANILLGKEKEVYPDEKRNDLTNDQIRELAGIYQNTGDHAAYMVLKAEDGELTNNDIPIKAISDNEFIGKVQVMRYSKEEFTVPTKNGTFVYKKVDTLSSAMPADQLNAFTGSFYSKDCAIRYTFSVEAGKLICARTNYDKITLSPLYKDGQIYTFRGLDNGLRALYHFTQNKTGQVESLALSIARAADIPFVKQ